jgi:uncharacterized membrane protein YgcG
MKIESGQLALAAFLMLLFVTHGPARASEQYPSLDEECFNDHAGVLGGRDRATIKSLCRKAAKGKVDMMVVTVKSLDDFRPRPLSVDRFVDTVFEDWDIGYEDGKNAVLLFVSIKENEFRIVMGDNYTDRLRKKARGIIRNSLVPAFRHRRRSLGLRKAYDALYHKIVTLQIKTLEKAKHRKGH